MKTQHTPGPWRVDTSEENIVRVIAPWSEKVTTANLSTFGDYRGGHICEMHWNTGVPKRSTAIANATLISAAPELLEALQECIKVYEETRDAQPTGHLWPDPNHILHARNAIKSATPKDQSTQNLFVHGELIETLVGVTKALERVLYKHDRDSNEHEWIGEANEVIKRATGQDLAKFKATE